jgi:hypothetical protein
MTVRDELLRIKGKQEFLVCEEVVAWAKQRPSSALHKRLEWDDKIAGHEYRCWQVRRLVAIHLTSEEGTRQFVSLSIDRSRESGGYRDVNDVIKSRPLVEIMLQDALVELQRIQLKYEAVQKLVPVWKEVEKIRQKTKRAKPGLTQLRSA